MRYFGFARPSSSARSTSDDAAKSPVSTFAPVDRRGFIVGGASAVATVGSARAAPETTALFAVQQSDSEIIIVFRNEQCAAPLTFKIPKGYWSYWKGNGNKSLQFDVMDVAVPPMPDGSTRRNVTIAIKNAYFAGLKRTFDAKFLFELVDSDCQISLTTTGWPRSGNTHFSPVNFVKFMNGSVLRTALSHEEPSILAKSLFGTGIRAGPKTGSLSLHNNLDWGLTGPFSTPVGLGSTPQIVEFDGLHFSPTTNPANPFSKDILGIAFPKMFDSPSGDQGGSAALGMAGHSARPLKAKIAVELGTYEKAVISGYGYSATVATFLQFGDPTETAWGLSGDFEVWVTRQIEEGPFLTDGATVVRYGSDGASGVARMPIASKPFEVSTAHGRFCIEALDPTIPQPGSDQIRPGVALSTSKGVIDSFEIDAQIRQAFVPFPADSLGSTRSFFSRLDFSDGDCKFVLDPLSDTFPLQSARSYIRLCAGLDVEPIRLGLDQATLRVVRPDDLLSLTFRFSGLALRCGGANSRIAPLRVGACDVHLASSVNEARRHGAPLAARFAAGAAVDERPIMVVEFPPQHVAERAYFRQIDDGADPPDVPLSDEVVDQLGAWFTVLDRYRTGEKVDIEQLVAARREIQFAKCAAERAGNAKPNTTGKTAVPANTVTFEQFCRSFEQKIEFRTSANLWPEDQKIYIGSEWLDPDVRRFARNLAAAMARSAATQARDRPSPSNDQKGDSIKSSSLLIDEAVREKLPPVDTSDPDFNTWAAAYDRWGERLFGGLPPYCGPDGVQALVDTGQIDKAKLTALVARIDADIADPEAFSPTLPTEARLSGPTRLAFRINCDDFDGDGGSFPFTLADLTNWSRFDLSVVRRAEKLLDFDSSGRLPPHWTRKEVIEPTSTLLHQGIYPARSWLTDAGTMSVSQRLDNVYASANTPPQPLETAIEFPFRLILSPAQDARWRTPTLMPRPGFPIPLWQASLDEQTSRASLRAIWSEDFQPQALRDGTPPPPHGVWTPWDAPEQQDDSSPPHSIKRFRAVMDAGDRHELVTLSSVYGLPVVGRRDSSGNLLSDGDQIEPPPGYRLMGLNSGGDAIYSPRALTVSEFALSALGGSISLDTHFQPPAGVTPLGSKNPLFVLDIERWRHTAVIGRDISVEVVYKGFLFPLGNRASLVKLTERRFMRHPAGGPTAYLIQRMFLRVGTPTKTFPALGQANVGRGFPPQSINILTRRTPDIVDPRDHPSITWRGSTSPYFREYIKGGVAFSTDGKNPLPGLVFWPRVSPSPSGNVCFEVQIDDTAGTVSMPMLFVDNVAAHSPDTMSALCQYYNSFVAEPLRTVWHGGTPRRYGLETKQGDSTFETLSWILNAEGGGDQTGFTGPSNNKNFEMTSPLEGADQPPFYPYLATCTIRINQVGKLTGGQAPIATAQYFFQYLKNGLPDNDNTSEVFLQIKAGTPLPPLAFGSAGDRAAGIGRPENQIVALSRKNGPIGGSKPLKRPPNGPNDTPAKDQTSYNHNFDPSKFDPKDFFGSFGKLLGIIELGDVLEAAADLAGMPQLSETIDYASTQAWDIVRQTILQPLRDLLNALDKTWASLGASTGKNASDQIRQVFPDVSAAEDALRMATANALSVTAPAIDQQAQLLGVVYEKARTFIQALQRMGANPIGPISIALLKKIDFNQYLETIDVLPFRQAAQKVSELIFDLIKNDAIFDSLCALRPLLEARNISANDVANLVSAFKKSVIEQLADPANQNPLDQILEQAFQEAIKQQSAPVKTALSDLIGTAGPDAKAGAAYLWLGGDYSSLGSQLMELRAQAMALAKVASDAVIATTATSIVQIIADLFGVFQKFSPLAAKACEQTASLAFSLLASTRPVDSETSIIELRDCVMDANKCNPTVGLTLGPIFLDMQSLLALRKTPSQLLLFQMEELAVAPTELKTWVTELHNSLRPPLMVVSDILSDLQQEPSPPLDEDIGKACLGLETLDNSDLKTLNKRILTPLRKGVAARLKLVRAILAVNQAVIRQLRSTDLPKISVKAGKRTVAAAVRIERLLAEFFLTNVVDALNAIWTQQCQIDPSLPPISLQIRLDRIDIALDNLDKLEDDATLDVGVLVDAAINAIPASVQADVDKIITQLTDPLFGASDLAVQVVGKLVPIVNQLASPLQSFDGFLERNAVEAQTGLNEIKSNAQIAAILQPSLLKVGPPIDDLVKKTAVASEALKNLENIQPPADQAGAAKALNFIAKSEDALRGIETSLTQVAKTIVDISQAILKGQIANLIDVNAPRREIESLIRDLVPHKATMAYSLNAQLTPLGDIFIPDLDRGPGKLTIDTKAVVDLLSPNQTPQTTIKGILDPVNIHLLGSAYDVVKLKFKQARFSSSPGSNFNFNIDIEDVELGEMVEFLEELQSYLTPSDGNGFYLRAASGVPGVEVGYGLNLGTISLGPVSFINVCLNAGCRLPFDRSNALFTISLSRPDSPFLISVGIYGGGGYLALIANGKKIVGFEASFEFGGVAAFSFGPLTGIGMLTTGIFVRNLLGKTTLDGFFFCGGSARIACFGISASLLVSISMQRGGTMAGQAVFSFSFSIGVAHIDFHITVFKTQPKLGGSTSAEPLVSPTTRLAEITSDLPPLHLASNDADNFIPTSGPRFRANTVSPNRNWTQYRKYFANEIRPRKQ